MKVLFVVCIVLLSSCATQHSVSDSHRNLSLADKLKEANAAYDEARLDKAEILFQAIVKDKPGLHDAWIRLGNVYVRQGRYKAAVRCFNEVIKLNKDDGRAWYNLALTRVKQAIDVLEAAEKTVPIDSEYQVYFLDLHTRLESKLRVSQNSN